jgi:hypothetical protein
MSLAYEKEAIRVRPRCGVDIFAVIKETLILAVEQGCPVEFDFNGTPVVVDPIPFIASIHKRWSDQR